MSAAMSEIVQLMQHDVPECRRQLQESHNNLEKVASYCEGNYLHAADKRHALEETKSYTTQSLASVAYQINTLATHFLQLLNLQMEQLGQMDSSINHLSQTVMIHKEKVARREIGVLTTNKTTSRMPGVKNPGIVFPDQPERPVKYVRRPIDFNALDDVGHGVKIQQTNPRPRRSSNTPSVSSSSGGAPTTRPPTPPSSIYNIPSGPPRSTITRNSSPQYRPAGPPPVSPPTVPDYGPGMGQRNPTGSLSRQSSSGADRRSHINRSSIQSQPPTSKVTPIVPYEPQSGPPISQPMPFLGPQISVDESTLPPPPMPDTPTEPYPEPPEDYDMDSVPSSPAFPPPPESGYDQMPGSNQYPFPSYMGPRPGASVYDPREPGTVDEPLEGVPEEYLEKVVAIYDYAKDKEDELSFSEGQVIYVVRKNDDGWWEGVLGRDTGLFPGNYVEPCI